MLLVAGREQMTRTAERDCAVEVTVAVIGGKWKPILLFHLLDGPLRYSELARRLPGASERMLTRSLRELETDGLLRRTAYAEVPTRVDYALTDRGLSLVPILQAMSHWGADLTRRPAVAE
jgi:DNA-binding HxlR family transcriptional regulator